MKPEHLREFVDTNLTPIRTCTFQPLLVETVPRELGVWPTSTELPRVQKALRRHLKRHGVSRFRVDSDDWRFIRKGDGGTVQAFEIRKTTHSDSVGQLANNGFRLPTSDEWEYLCGAGTRQLYRWGAAAPNDRYPQDKLADAKIVETLQKADPHDGTSWEPNVWEWDLHRRPNAWGLEIAQNPYDLEVVDELDVLRGGDGGASFCDGSCYQRAWLTLANSHVCRRELDPRKLDGLPEEFVEAMIRQHSSQSADPDVTLKFARRILEIDDVQLG